MSRRTEKVQEAIRETIAMSILSEVQDPRVKNVTVISCKVSGDLRQAKVYVSVMGTEAQQNLCLKGLKSCAGFLQTKIAQRIKSRFVPHLEFYLDQGVKKSIMISQMLKEVLPPKEEPEDEYDEELDEEFDEDFDDSEEVNDDVDDPESENEQ